MRYAIVTDGVVINIAEAAAPQAPNWMDVPEGAAIGDTLVDGVLTKAALPAEQPPAKVPMASARIALLRHGITRATVEAAISAIPNEQARAEALIDWEYRTEIRRSAPLVAALAPALNLTEQQVDDLFREADSI